MNGVPDAGRYLVGGQPHDVVVPAEVAHWLAQRGLGDLRTKVRGGDAKRDAVLMALHIAALEYDSLRDVSGDVSDSLTESAIPKSLSRGAGPSLDPVAVAALLGCGPANVRDLARRGRLRGDRIGGRWCFTQTDVDGLLAARAD